jgi:O-antigen/teichoic acid export membrane protein
MFEGTEKRQLLLQGTFILSMAALMTKILSAVYRIPFQNIVGDIGFYIYQQVYPFYGIAISLATYGFPVIISKLYAELLSSGEKQKAERMLFPTLIGIFLLCFFCFFCIFYFSSSIATTMGDANLKPMISLVSFSFLLVPFISVLRGYFQGKGMMVPTAMSQIGEQFIRVTFILMTAVLFVNAGESLYRVGQGAILSSIFGGVFAIFMLTCFFLFNNKKNIKVAFLTNLKESLPIIKTVIIQGLAICVSSLTLVLFQMCDAFQIFSVLKNLGIPIEEAQQIKGIYDRGQPLLQLGLVLATSLSLSIVPIIASMKQKGKDITSYIRLCIQISITVGAAATVGLILIMNEVNTMLFQNDDGSYVLRILMIAILLASFSMSVSAMLQGLGYVYFPAFVVLTGLVIKVILNQLLIRHWGVTGAALATVIALSFVSFFLYWKLHTNVSIKLLHREFITKLIFSLCTMILVVLFIQFTGSFLKESINEYRFYASIFSLLASLLGGVVFLISLLCSGIFTREALEMIPFGKKMYLFFNRKNEVKT